MWQRQHSEVGLELATVTQDTQEPLMSIIQNVKQAEVGRLFQGALLVVSTSIWKRFITYLSK